MIAFAIEYREFLFRLDALACAVISLCGVYVMQVIPRIADRQEAIGQPWPVGLETTLRIFFGIAATAGTLVPAEYLTGKVHFVLVEEVVMHVAIAALGILCIAYRETLFPTRPNS